MEEFKSKYDATKQLHLIQAELMNERRNALQLQNILNNYSNDNIVKVLESTNNKLEKELETAIQSKLQLCTSTSLEIMRLRQKICSLTNQLHGQYEKTPPTNIVRNKSNNSVNKNQITIETIEKGDGMHYANPFSIVEITYIGWKYENNINQWIKLELPLKENQTFETPLGNGENIFGLEQAILSMSKGEIANVFIPSRLAYGGHGCPPLIQPNQDLKFQLTLIDTDTVKTNMSDITKNKRNSLKERGLLINGYVNKNYDGFIPIDIIKLFVLFYCSNDLNLFHAKLSEDITFKANDIAFTAKLNIGNDLMSYHSLLSLEITIDELPSSTIVIVQFEINCEEIGFYECGYAQIHDVAQLCSTRSRLDTFNLINTVARDSQDKLQFSFRFTASVEMDQFGSIYHVLPEPCNSIVFLNHAFNYSDMYVTDITCDWILSKYMLPDGLLKGDLFFGQNCFCLQCENVNNGETLQVYLKLMIPQTYYDHIDVEYTLTKTNNKAENAVINGVHAFHEDVMAIMLNQEAKFFLIDMLDSAAYSLHLKVTFGNVMVL